MQVASAPTGAHCIVYYVNHSGQVKSRSIYNDMKMNRCDKEEKTKEVASSLVYKRILTQEMKLRVMAEGVLCMLNHEPLGSDWLVPLKYFMKERRLVFEEALIQWAQMTGEMRNHQWLAAHEDANKSHGYESITIFGKKRGQLYFPGHDFMVEYRPGIDAAICHLEHVIHVSDGAGVENWTKVHGPPWSIESLDLL